MTTDYMTRPVSSTTDSQSSARALSIENITLDVKDGSATRRILDNVSVSVAGGEVLGITGPSGSGKSTLLAIAGALQQPTSGAVSLTDAEGNHINLTQHAPSSRKAAGLRRDHLGIVFQQANLYPSLNILDQLLVMTRLNRVMPIRGEKWRREREKANRLLQQVGLEGMDDRMPSQLSGGQQARVNVARALMNEPDVLLIDEPTAALDSEAARTITQLIQQLVAETKIPALYVSHDTEQLGELDRVITLRDGMVE